MRRQRGFFRIEKFARIYDRRTGKFTVDIRYQTKTDITPRTIGVAEAFGLGVDDYQEYVIYDDVSLKIGPMDIVYITGESGSGKSVLLRALEKDLGDEAVNIDSINLDLDKPIIETVGRDLNEALELLSRVGLNDAFLFLRRCKELSNGQRYRYRIAKMIESGRQWWIMDEFCATLDRETAKIVAFNVQKQARRSGRAVIAATTHMDLFEDLAPSVHIHKGWGKRLEVRYYPNQERKICGVTRGLRIEEGTLEDYEKLAEFHYRNPGTRPVPMKIFSLRKDDNEPVGVIYYSWPPINSVGRKQAVGRKLSLKEVNESLATISRVILHPKYRSIGLGIRLVEETLPLVGKPYVETMAVMAQYTPFFEKAGMRKVAVRQPPESICRAVKDLEKLGFRPYLLASAPSNLEHLQVLSREEVEEARRILMSAGYYKRLGGRGGTFVRKKEFEEWIKDKSLEELAKVLARLAVLAETKVYLFWTNPYLEASPITLTQVTAYSDHGDSHGR